MIFNVPSYRILKKNNQIKKSAYCVEIGVTFETYDCLSSAFLMVLTWYSIDKFKHWVLKISAKIFGYRSIFKQQMYFDTNTVKRCRHRDKKVQIIDLNET